MRKELITLDRCKADIASEYKGAMIAISFVACFVVAIPLMTWLEYGAELLLYLEFALASVIIIWSVSYLLRTRGAAREDSFCIVCDSLSDKKEIKLGKRGDERITYVLVFSEGRTYEIPEKCYRWQEKKISAKKLSSTCEVGDEFYLICTKEKGGEVLAVYNKRHFELSGELSARVVKQEY